MSPNQTVAESKLSAQLVADIENCGFFPQLIIDSVQQALGGESIVEHLVQHEVTLAHEALGRHLTVLVLTGSRLIVCHTDESSEYPHGPVAVSSIESVPLRTMGAVALTRVVAHPEHFGAAGGAERAGVVETWLNLTWQTIRKIDLEPARCDDPNCEADHGYTGGSVAEDMVVRMSPTADGEANVARLLAFATALQSRVR